MFKIAPNLPTLNLLLTKSSLYKTFIIFFKPKTLVSFPIPHLIHRQIVSSLTR